MQIEEQEITLTSQQEVALANELCQSYPDKYRIHSNNPMLLLIHTRRMEEVFLIKKWLKLGAGVPASESKNVKGHTRLVADLTNALKELKQLTNAQRDTRFQMDRFLLNIIDMNTDEKTLNHILQDVVSYINIRKGLPGAFTGGE